MKLNLITYRIKPFCLHGSVDPAMAEPGGAWLHDVINQLMNSNKARLQHAEVRTDVFHNHDEKETRKTKKGYPLLLFQHFHDNFYVTGINDGAKSLEELVKPYGAPVAIGRKSVLLGFVPWGDRVTFTPELTTGLNRYTLTDWLALGTDNNKRYKKLNDIRSKIDLLEEVLHGHVYANFLEQLFPGQYHSVDIRLRILDVSDFSRSCLHVPRGERTYDYQPFNIVFEANLTLPEWITLGNCQSLGFGLLKRLHDQ